MEHPDTDHGGGALALHKTCWRILSWQLELGKLKTLQATKKSMRMADGKGAYIAIEYKWTDQPNEGLGYCICPDKNQTHAYKAIMKNMAEMWQKIGAVYLSERGRKVCYNIE